MQKDKKKALLWSIGYLIAALIFHFAWPTELAVNYHNGWFAGVDMILWAAFAVFTVWWYKDAETEYSLWVPYAVFFNTIALIGWSAGWAVGLLDRI